MALELKKQMKHLLFEQYIPDYQQVQCAEKKHHHQVSSDTQSMPLYELASNQMDNRHRKHLIKDFEDIYGQQMLHEDTFYFPSEKEAINFFQHQAELGLSFLVKKSGEDHFLFSDGNGNFFQGSQDELDHYLQASQETKAQPEPSSLMLLPKIVPEPNAGNDVRENERNQICANYI